MPSLMKALDVVVVVIEAAVAVALVVLSAFALFTLGGQIVAQAATGATLTAGEFNRLIGGVLEIFILIELFRIAVAYMTHRNVIPTVLEAALVAVARKFVVFEGGTNYLNYALGLSALLLAVAIAWWMLARSNACELTDE